MIKFLNFIPEIPIADAVESATDTITEVFAFLFDPISKHFGQFMEQKIIN